MPGLWETVWAAGRDLPRVGGVMRTGAVLAMAAGGSGERPLVAVLSAPGHTDDEGDHLRVWHVATGQVAAVPVPPARCVTASGEAGWRRVPSAVGGWATGGLWW